MADYISLREVADMFQTDYNVVKSWASHGMLGYDSVGKHNMKLYDRDRVAALAIKYLSEKGDCLSQREVRTLTGFSDSKIARLIHEGKLHRLGRISFDTDLFDRAEVEYLVENDTLSAREAAREIGISVEQLRNLENEGWIFRVGTDRRGQHVYLKTDVKRIKGGV